MTGQEDKARGGGAGEGGRALNEGARMGQLLREGEPTLTKGQVS